MTTETKHTPEPWTLEGLHICAPSRGHGIQGTETIATVRNDIYADHVEANARLIAAAPELVDVLRRLEGAVATFSALLVTKNGVLITAELADAAWKAETALAKLEAK